jgi:hypothetical protein
MPADERLSDSSSDCTAEVIQAGQQPDVMLSVVLSPPELPEKISQERKETQNVKHECQEFLSRQLF